MDYKEEEHIYNLTYKGKITHYLDDVLFQDKDINLNLTYECPRISELSLFIEEFVTSYLSKEDFERNVITISCGSLDHEVDKIPEIINKKDSSVYLSSEKNSMMDIFGEEKIIVDYEIDIDIIKPYEVIARDIKRLEDENESFSFYKMMGEKLNIKNDEQLRALIGSARLDLIKNPDYSFMMMEYSHLRKYVPLSQKLALRTISKIYDFLPSKIKN